MMVTHKDEYARYCNRILEMEDEQIAKETKKRKKVNGKLTQLLHTVYLIKMLISNKEFVMTKETDRDFAKFVFESCQEDTAVLPLRNNAVNERIVRSCYQAIQHSKNAGGNEADSTPAPKPKSPLLA